MTVREAANSIIDLSDLGNPDESTKTDDDNYEEGKASSEPGSPILNKMITFSNQIELNSMVRDRRPAVRRTSTMPSVEDVDCDRFDDIS